MHAASSACAGFLIAVLWFDLMFDVQARRSGEALASAEALASIAAYYRRVTTQAAPMSNLIAGVMLAVLGTVIVELVAASGRSWTGWLSLPTAVAPIALALTRTVPNAARLGREQDPPEVQSRLARTVLADHVFAWRRWCCYSTLQLIAALA